MKRTLKIESKNAGKTITTTISSANPAASDLDLRTFATALNDLTKNTYVDTIRRDEIPLSEAN